MGMGGVIDKEIKYVILPINNGNLIIVCLFIQYVRTDVYDAVCYSHIRNFESTEHFKLSKMNIFYLIYNPCNQKILHTIFTANTFYFMCKMSDSGTHNDY